ncbi:Autocrine proliferation repressor protein A [Lamellibrachia satsuma]|nr:Autocrine proliferation repressor protein A [Lamellibrachia satsuma]
MSKATTPPVQAPPRARLFTCCTTDRLNMLNRHDCRRRDADTLTLTEYVNRPDPTYMYYEINRTQDHNHTAYYLNMTSQMWMDEGFSDSSIWWHDLVISVPHTIIVPDVALLFIGGGSNTRDSLPTPEHDVLSAALQRMSVEIGVVVGFIKQIPNQPIVFKADPTKKGRIEGDLCGYLWRTFIENEEASPEMLARYPMTKAVVRAMDTLTNFTRQVAPTTNITKFVVAGASKRGWATWTTTAVDKRVVAQMPIVMTLLNFHEIMEHEQSSLGGWTYAMSDYYYQNITRYLDHPRLGKIMDLVDPYNFLDKYNLPTMVVDGTGDQFFLPDNSYFFFNKLPGFKYMLMMPNHDHFLNPISDVMTAIGTFTVGVVTGYHFPRVSWKLIETTTGGQIVFNSSDVEPTSVSSWYAVTDTALRRDFRANYGVKANKSHVFWLENVITDQHDGIYVAEYDRPVDGWLGFLVMAKYAGPLGYPLTLTSEVNIIPNTLPYPRCHGEGCYETLV